MNKPAVMNNGYPITGAEVISQGQTLVKTEAGYQTAITVQKPRSLAKIEQAVLAESEFATDDFFYQWIVISKDGKREVIQGGTISLALCMAREWTNNVVKVDVEEKEGSWVFKGSFIDLERGSTVERLFRKSIPRTSAGKYESDRWVDMMFQKAQSQALRNVIFSSLPRWLKDKAVEKARDAALRNIETYGLEKAKDMILLPLLKLGVSSAQVETYLAKPHKDWDKEDLLLLRNLVVQIRNGDVSLEEVLSSGKGPKANHESKATQTESPRANPGHQSSTSNQPPSQTQPAAQPATPQEPQSSQPPTNQSDKLKDLYTKLYSMGLKDLKEQYKEYLKEKYTVDPESLTDDQIGEQKRILENCRAKFERLKEFKALLQSKTGLQASSQPNQPNLPSNGTSSSETANGSEENQPKAEVPEPDTQTDSSNPSDPSDSKEFSLF